MTVQFASVRVASADDMRLRPQQVYDAKNSNKDVQNQPLRGDKREMKSKVKLPYLRGAPRSAEMMEGGPRTLNQNRPGILRQKEAGFRA